MASIELFEGNETVMHKFLYVLEHFEEYKNKIGKAYTGKSGSDKFLEGEAYRTLLKKYPLGYVEGKGVRTVYNQRSRFLDETKFGRYFVDNALGFQTFSRQLRHTCLKDQYYDIDIKNAHPTFLLQLCEREGVEIKYLREYVENRDTVLSWMMDNPAVKVSKEDGKRLLLSLLNGKKTVPMEFRCDEWVMGYFKECKETAMALSEKGYFKKYFETAKVRTEDKEKKSGWSNPLGTFVNYVLCDIENDVLQVIRAELEEKGCVSDILCFDGCMVRIKNNKDELLSKKDIERMFSTIEESIRTSLGYTIQLSVKDMDEAIPLPIGWNDKPLSMYLEQMIIQRDQATVKRLMEGMCSNVDGALIFAEKNMHRIIYLQACGWVMFNDKTRLWRLHNDRTQLIHPVSNYFSTLIRYERQILTAKKELTEADMKYEKVLMGMYQKVASSSWARGVVDQLQEKMTRPDEELEKFESNAHLFCFSDGSLIDLKNNGERRMIDEKDYITTTCGYPYKPFNAENEKLAMSFVYTLYEDHDQTKSLLSMLACTLIGKNINEAMFIWTGSAGNGKGTLDTALQTVLGKYYASVDMSQLTAYDKEKDRANSQLASTQFARCVMATEPETSYGSDTLKSSTIKKWTGNDKIRARFLRGQSFEFIPKFTLYIQTNDTPNLSKRDNGTDRRINVMKFPFVFDAEREVSEDDHAQGHRVKDITMKSKLETDERYRYGLLHLMVNQWLETNGKYYVSQKVKEATKEYMNKNNELNEWGRLNLFALCVDIPKKKWAKAEDLFDKYKSENPTSNIRNQTDFTKLLKELNLFKFDINNKKTVFCCEYSPHKVAQQKTKQTSEEEDDE